jgi:hypothetical protein
MLQAQQQHPSVAANQARKQQQRQQAGRLPVQVLAAAAVETPQQVM